MRGHLVCEHHCLQGDQSEDLLEYPVLCLLLMYVVQFAACLAGDLRFGFTRLASELMTGWWTVGL